MNLFRKIFSSESKEQKKSKKKKIKVSFLQKKNLPVDELFTVNFNENGGKFLYCEGIDEVYEFLNQIIEENNWNDKSALILNSKLKNSLKISAGRLLKNSPKVTIYLQLVKTLLQVMVQF